MLKRIWGGKPKIQIGDNADATMWNTGVETPTAILCGLLATKILNHKLDPSVDYAPSSYEFDLKTEGNSVTTPKRIRVMFSGHQFYKIEVLNKNHDRMFGEEASFSKFEQEVFQKAYNMLNANATKLNAAWKVEQNQNKALKLIEGLVE